MFYHGSLNRLSIGLELCSQIDGYVQSVEDRELEDLMESMRPVDKVSRNEAVFFCSDIELIDPLGGYTDYVYSVEPLFEYHSCDLAWYGEAHKRLLESDIEGAKEAAMNYWSGVIYKDTAESVYEYLCVSVEVLEEVEVND